MKRILTLSILFISLICFADAPRVSLLTFYPGSDIYELEGHTALRVIDSRGDITYNWGTFDFDSPNFVYRFVKGETDYMVTAVPTAMYLSHYAAHGRRVDEQVLNLNGHQADSLVALIDRNMLPENRVYRYNYVLDNCATRPLRLIEQASGDSLSIAPYSGHGNTFREIMTYYHRNYPWYQFGIDLALGSGLDRPVTTRMKAFAPTDLQQILAVTSFTDSGNSSNPAVSGTLTLIEGKPGGATLGPTPWWLTPLFWTCVVMGLTALVSWNDFLRYKRSRLFDTMLYSLFGILGLVLTFLIFISVHEATSPNWLYLWLNPMCLFIAVGVWIKKWQRAVYWWQIINFALVLTLSLIGAFGVQRLNVAFWPLIISDLMRSIMYIYNYRCNSTPRHP